MDNNTNPELTSLKVDIMALVEYHGSIGPSLVDELGVDPESIAFAAAQLVQSGRLTRTGEFHWTLRT